SRRTSDSGSRRAIAAAPGTRGRRPVLRTGARIPPGPADNRPRRQTLPIVVTLVKGIPQFIPSSMTRHLTLAKRGEVQAAKPICADLCVVKAAVQNHFSADLQFDLG